MDDFPRTVAEFEARFATEDACRTYLARLRWPDGFRCRCGDTNAWWTARGLWQCTACGAQTSITAGTVFQDTRKPLRAGRRRGARTLHKFGQARPARPQAVGVR